MKYKREIPLPTEYETVDATLSDVIDLIRESKEGTFPHNEFESVKYKNFEICFMWRRVEVRTYIDGTTTKQELEIIEKFIEDMRAIKE